MNSSTVSYKQSLQYQGGVNYIQIDIFCVAPNLQVVVIIKKGENVNHASFDDVEKKSHVCHHQKGGECECMYT